jgi:hypothetical protein
MTSQSGRVHRKMDLHSFSTKPRCCDLADDARVTPRCGRARKPGRGLLRVANLKRACACASSTGGLTCNALSSLQGQPAPLAAAALASRAAPARRPRGCHDPRPAVALHRPAPQLRVHKLVCHPGAALQERALRLRASAAGCQHCNIDCLNVLRPQAAAMTVRVVASKDPCNCTGKRCRSARESGRRKLRDNLRISIQGNHGAHREVESSCAALATAPQRCSAAVASCAPRSPQDRSTSTPRHDEMARLQT